MSTAQQDRNFIESVVGNDLLENSIEWICNNMYPEEVFSQVDLKRWAQENGYKKED